MSKRRFRNWLKTFTEYGSYGEAPLKMLFWTGVSAVAGALRRRVWIDQKFFQWVPNFYIVFVAPPGIVAKSTTSSIGMNLLRDVPGIRFGPDVVTWQALIQTLASCGELVPDPRDPMTMHPMSALTIESSEFGTFFNPDNAEMVDVLVSLWDGKRGSFQKITKTSGSDKIENPWINVIACTTPSWIAGRFPEYLIGGGFTSRCVFLYADRKRQTVPYIDEAVPKMFNETREHLVADLEQISLMFGEYQLSDDAREWGKTWYDTHWNTPSALNTDQYAGYLARKQTHIHKLAMVLAASRSDELVITLDSLTTAEAMVTAVEQDMPKVFARIGQNDLTRGAATIVDLVDKAQKATKMELYKQLFRTMSYRDFELSLTSAIQSGFVVNAQEGDQIILRPKRQ
jgi:hypothetical protein